MGDASGGGNIAVSGSEAVGVRGRGYLTERWVLSPQVIPVPTYRADAEKGIIRMPLD